jgi:hypothetical protein
MSAEETTPAEEIATPAAESTSEKKSPSEAGRKRLSTEKWTEIETHWECGTMTGREICAKYDVTPKALRAHLDRHKIEKDSKKLVMKAAAEIKIMGAVAAAEDPLAVGFEQKRRGRITQTREYSYQLSQLIASRMVKIFKDVQDGTRKEADCVSDIRMLRNANVTVGENFDIRMRILDAESDIDEKKLPVLSFRDLTQEEIAARANADEEEEFGALPAEEVAADPEDDVIIEEGEPLAS